MKQSELKIKGYQDFLNQFNSKIDKFKNHIRYDWLKNYSDEAIKYNQMTGLYAIKANDFMKRIICASENIVTDWLDGKKELEWSLIENEKENG